MANTEARQEFIREMMVNTLSRSKKYSENDIRNQLQTFFALKLRKEHSAEIKKQLETEIKHFDEIIEQKKAGVIGSNAEVKEYIKTLDEYRSKKELEKLLKTIELTASEQVQYANLSVFFEQLLDYDDKKAKECQGTAYECFVEEYKKAKALVNKEVSKYNSIIADYLELINKRQFNKNKELEDYMNYIKGKIIELKNQTMLDDVGPVTDVNNIANDWSTPVPKNFNFTDNNDVLDKLLDSGNEKKLSKFTPEQIATMSGDQLKRLEGKHIKYISKDALRALGSRINDVGNDGNRTKIIQSIDDDEVLKHLNPTIKKALLETNKAKYIEKFKTEDLNVIEFNYENSNVQEIYNYLLNTTKQLKKDNVEQILKKNNEFDSGIWNILANPKRVPDAVLKTLNFVDCQISHVQQFVKYLGIRINGLKDETLKLIFSNNILLSNEQYRLLDTTKLNDAFKTLQFKDDANSETIVEVKLEGGETPKITDKNMTHEDVFKLLSNLGTNINKLNEPNLNGLVNYLVKYNEKFDVTELKTIFRNISDKEIIEKLQKGITYKGRTYKLDELSDAQKIIVKLPTKKEEQKNLAEYLEKISLSTILMMITFNLMNEQQTIEENNARKQETNAILSILGSILQSSSITNKMTEDIKLLEDKEEERQKKQVIQAKQQETEALFENLNNLTRLIPIANELNSIYTSQHLKLETNNMMNDLANALRVFLMQNNLIETTQAAEENNRVQQRQNMNNSLGNAVNISSLTSQLVNTITKIAPSSPPPSLLGTEFLSSPSVQPARHDAPASSVRPAPPAPPLLPQTKDILQTLSNTVKSIQTIHSQYNLMKSSNQMQNTAEMQESLRNIVHALTLTYQQLHLMSETNPSKRETKQILDSMNTIVTSIGPLLLNLYYNIANSKNRQHILTNEQAENLTLHNKNFGILGGAPPEKKETENKKDDKKDRTLSSNEEVDFDKILTDLENWRDLYQEYDIESQVKELNNNLLQGYVDVLKNATTQLNIDEYKKIEVDKSSTISSALGRLESDRNNNEYREKIIGTDIKTQLETLKNKITKLDKQISGTDYFKTVMDYVDKYKQLNDKILTYYSNKSHFIPFLISSELEKIKENIRLFNKELEKQKTKISEWKTQIDKTTLTSLTRTIDTIISQLTDPKQKPSNDSKLDTLKNTTEELLAKLKNHKKKSIEDSYEKRIEDNYKSAKEKKDKTINEKNSILLKLDILKKKLERDRERDRDRDREDDELEEQLRNINKTLEDDNRAYEDAKKQWQEMRDNYTYIYKLDSLDELIKAKDILLEILKKVLETVKKKARNPTQKATDLNEIDNTLTTDSIYKRIWDNYVDDTKDTTKLLEKTQDKFYRAFKNNNLDPEEALKLTTDDKILFCIIIFVIRQIALGLTELLIDYGYVNILHNALVAYSSFYILVIILIIIVINLDDYKLRIMFNYFNMHINPNGIFSHVFMVIGLMILMYTIIYNIDKNIANKKAAITEIEKMRLIYKLELMTIFVFIIVSAITVVM